MSSTTDSDAIGSEGLACWAKELLVEHTIAVKARNKKTEMIARTVCWNLEPCSTQKIHNALTNDDITSTSGEVRERIMADNINGTLWIIISAY